jgi:hypothetical protein
MEMEMGAGWTVALVILAAFFVWRGAVRHRKDVATRAIQAAPVELFAEGLELWVEVYYQDAKGEKSLRRVTIERLQGIRPAGMPPAVTSFEGKCHLRNSRCSFKMAQVLSMADTRSGEVLADPGGWLLRAAADPATPRASKRRTRAEAVN